MSCIVGVSCMIGLSGLNVCSKCGSQEECSCDWGTYLSSSAGTVGHTVTWVYDIGRDSDTAQHIAVSLNTTELMADVFQGQASCLECPTGAICLGNVLPPIAQPGYGIVTSATTSAFYECMARERCPGPGCDCEGGKHHMYERGSRRGVITVPMQCTKGYKDGSPLCSECEEDYAIQKDECKASWL